MSLPVEQPSDDARAETLKIFTNNRAVHNQHGYRDYLDDEAANVIKSALQSPSGSKPVAYLIQYDDGSISGRFKTRKHAEDYRASGNFPDSTKILTVYDENAAPKADRADKLLAALKKIGDNIHASAYVESIARQAIQQHEAGQ